MDNSHDYNKGGLIALVLSVGFCFVFFIYVSFVDPGVDLKEVPAGSEGPVVAGGAVPPEIDVSKITAPWEENPVMVAHGQRVYKNACAVCHGSEGKGDGPGGASLPVPPRNFVEGKWKQGGSSIALYKTIHDGIEGTSMASFKHMPKVDRWALVQFIRSITQNKVPDDKAKLAEFGAGAK